MLQYLTGSDLFAYIQMQRQLDRRAVIVLEGPEDCGIIDPHLHVEAAHSIPGYGKQSVVDAAALLDHAEVDHVRLVIDADFDRQLGLTSGLPPNIVITEYHDLDADVFFSCPSVLSSVLANFTDRTIRQQYFETSQKDPLDVIIDIAGVVGVVRYHSILHDLHLKMRDFPTTPLMAPYEQTGSAVSAVLQLAFARSRRSDQTLEHSIIGSFITGVADLRPYCNGHDLFAVMSSFVRERWGGSAGSNVLANAIRAAVPCACWQKTRIYTELQSWGAALKLYLWTCA